MSARISVAPDLLRWARRRSGRELADLHAKFPKLQEWEAQASHPTVRQLEEFAHATHTPLGYFFLSEAPTDTLPIRDFRTVSNAPIEAPSPDLLDTISLCQRRQDWFHNYAVQNGIEPVDLVGSATADSDVAETAALLREELGFTLSRRSEFSSWTEAVSGLSELIEGLGILVMISGVVGSNTHRVLDPGEFRGFTLIDDHAPLIFVNGSDSKSAQMFTLAHELAHVLLGTSGVSREDLGVTDDVNAIEAWCNALAAELLVPSASLLEAFDDEDDLASQLAVLSRLYKVSRLVVLRRLYDADKLPKDLYWDLFQAERDAARQAAAGHASGGNFYNTAPVRASKAFARAIIADTIEGRTTYRDAYRLLGLSSSSAFDGMRDRLGVA